MEIDKSPDASDVIVKVAKNIFFMATPVAVIWGLLYLTAFWSVFDINVLQYAGLVDLLMPTLLPIALSLFFVSVGVFLSEMSNVDGVPLLARAVIANPDRMVRLRKEYGAVILSIWVMGSIVIMTFCEQWKWKVFPWLFAVAITPSIMSHDLVPKFVPSRFKLLFVIFFVVSFPVALSRGFIAAYEIKEGTRYLYTVGSHCAKNPEQLIVRNCERFIAHVGDYDFLYSPLEKSVSILRVKKDNVLVLRSYVASAKSAPQDFWQWIINSKS